jgi:hypothetical protein
MGSSENSEHLSKTALRDALASDAGVRQLIKMAAAQSISNNLAAEDEMARREEDAYFSELHDVPWKPNAGRREPAMHAMAARDIFINSQPDPVPAPVSAPQKTVNPLLAAALGAALLAGGMAIPKLLEKTEPVESERQFNYDATNIEAVQIYTPVE